MSAAHGGQVLVSGATHDRLKGEPDLTLRSLGHYELRGLADRHELFQVEAAGLASELPPPAV